LSSLVDDANCRIMGTTMVTLWNLPRLAEDSGTEGIITVEAQTYEMKIYILTIDSFHHQVTSFPFLP